MGSDILFHAFLIFFPAGARDLWYRGAKIASVSACHPLAKPSLALDEIRTKDAQFSFTGPSHQMLCYTLLAVQQFQEGI